MNSKNYLRQLCLSYCGYPMDKYYTIIHKYIHALYSDKYNKPNDIPMFLTFAYDEISIEDAKEFFNIYMKYKDL